MKTVLLNSGGLDSLACAMLLKKEGHEVQSLYVDLGYPNDAAAQKAAALIASTYCVGHAVVKVSGLPAHGMLPGDAPTGGFRSVAHQQMILTALGASYAQVRGYSTVCSGTRNDIPVGKDYAAAFNAAIANYQKVWKFINPLELVQPINGINSMDWLYSIIKDSPVLHQTVSCLSETPCGTCFKCIGRAKYAI